jgi:hypothetical protein
MRRVPLALQAAQKLQALGGLPSASPQSLGRLLVFDCSSVSVSHPVVVVNVTEWKKPEVQSLVWAL